MSKQNQSMPFWDHVEELRRRLFVMVCVLGATTIASLVFSERLINFLALPIGSLQNLQSIEVTENISVVMRVALLSGVILSMPVILYEFMAFVLPGLKSNEKRWLYVVIVFGTMLFLTGVAFAYFVMLPASVKFLIELLAVETKPRLSNYINFITNLLFWIGMGFQLPLIIYALARFKLVTAKTLAKKWRYGVVIIAVVAAVITPTVDPVNMALLMIPLLVLYWLSVFMAYLAAK